MDAVIARLKPGISIEAARQELNAMPSASEGGRQVTLKLIRDVVTGSVRNSLLVLLGAVGMVLLVACVNVANLLLTRVASRDREIAVRAALGASRWRLVRQMLTESLLLASTGAVAGLWLGIWGSGALVRYAAAQLPRVNEIGMDWRVFAFLLVVCVIVGIAFGIAPAFAAARGGSLSLKGRAITTSVRDSLVVAEVALAFVLLAGAGLLMRTFWNLQRIDAGVHTENVLTVHMVVADGPESAAIIERVSKIPGVRATGFISMLPLQSSGWNGGFNIPGRPGIRPTELRYVTPGYFRAMGIPLRRGRGFSEHDGVNQERVIIINEALARQNFPNEDPVGIRTDRGVIIGIVGDVRQVRLSDPATPEIFYTMAQNFVQLRSNGSTLVVRGHVPVENLTPAIRAAVREISPNQGLFRMVTMKQVMENSIANQRLYAWLLGLFSGVGAMLAVAGIYGVISYLVKLRTQEFGIRMALGANSGNVLGLVLRRGVVIVSLGLLIGIGCASLLTRVLRNLLYDIAPTDPATFASMAVLLTVVALVACVIPARRAAHVDPAVALRVE